MESSDNILPELVRDLALRYQRKPTVEETYNFIFGDLELRRQTWDKVPAGESPTYQVNQEELDQTLDELTTYLSTGEHDAPIPPRC